MELYTEFNEFKKKYYEERSSKRSKPTSFIPLIDLRELHRVLENIGYGDQNLKLNVGY